MSAESGGSGKAIHSEVSGDLGGLGVLGLCCSSKCFKYVRWLRFVK